MATGSYEGSLSIEDIPDQKRGAAFTRGVYEWSWRSSHPPTPTNLPKRRRRAKGKEQQLEGSFERREDEKMIATGLSEARSHQHRGKKTPTLAYRKS
jgi:hypothetical protein